jgi:N-methylhydantoinase A
MNRRHHYDLQWDKPHPYVERRDCLEVRERVDYRGEVLEPLDEDEVRRAIATLRRRGIRDVAVSFLFSYVNPAHELRVRELVAELHPEATVSLSHEVFPRWREYDRTSTTLADAFLRSLVSDYVEGLAEGLAGFGLRRDFLIMKSNGGVETWRAAAGRPVDLIVSGPAGGVLGALHVARATGRTDLVSIDMGGTSFDVSLIEDGRVARTTEHEIEWGLPVYTPMVDVKTIGAGGGSIGWIDKGGLLRVGPRSAGADPGPACYGRGGTDATVTDANLALGRLDPANFLGGEMPLAPPAASAALDALGQPLGLGADEVALAMLELVDQNMVNAIRLVSIDRGIDPRDFTLVAFGGAGPLHAGSLAEILGIEEVLVPVHQSVFSALGLMAADMRVDESVTASFRSDRLEAARLDELVRRLRRRALSRLRDEGYRGVPLVEAAIEMRYLGQNHGTDVAVPLGRARLGASELALVLERFHGEHRRLYGYDIPGEIVELVHVKVTAIGPTEKPELPPLPRRGAAAPRAARPVRFRDGWLDTPVYERSRLGAGARLDGPAVVEEPTSTTLVHPGQRLRVDRFGNLVLSCPAVR